MPPPCEGRGKGHAAIAAAIPSMCTPVPASSQGRLGVDRAGETIPFAEGETMRWVLFVPLLILLALFALSNQQEVEIRLWPFDIAWVSSLGIAVLILSAVAFLVGAGIAWASALPVRRRAARIEQAARLLEGELASYRAKEEQARRDADMGRVPESAVVPSSQPALAGPR